MINKENEQALALIRVGPIISSLHWSIVPVTDTYLYQRRKLNPYNTCTKICSTRLTPRKTEIIGKLNMEGFFLFGFGSTIEFRVE